MDLMDRVNRIYRAVCENPGVLQYELRELIGTDEKLIRDMWRAGIIEREPAPDTWRRTFRLFPVKNPDSSLLCKKSDEQVPVKQIPIAAIEGNMRRSALHRAKVKLRVKEAMERNPQLGLRSLAKIVKVSIGTVGPAYRQFKRGEL